MPFETLEEKYTGSHDSMHIDLSPIDKPDSLCWDVHIDTDPVILKKGEPDEREIWEMLIRMEPSSRMLLITRPDYGDDSESVPAVYRGGDVIELCDRKDDPEGKKIKNIHNTVVAMLDKSFGSHTFATLEVDINRMLALRGLK